MIEPHQLAAALEQAIERRAPLLQQLHAAGTDCYRLLHGVAEGAPGVTLDRYGPVLLLQTFRNALAAQVVERLRTVACRALTLDLPIACNHRGTPPPPGFVEHAPAPEALAENECHEAGVRFLVRARHRGQDPWVFLDLRAGRSAVRSLAAGRSVLNLFAYTCAIGVAAAVAGARRVLNVDFSQTALDVGVRNAERNGIANDRFTVLRSDCIPVLRQLAGLPVQRPGRNVPFPRIEVQRFDLVVLDPPRLAKGPFGTVDVVNDYQSLWKPCVLALAEGGVLIATNHVPEVDEAGWHEDLRRCAAKAGRPLQSLESIAVDADFPSFDGKPPLKVVLARV
ncbi:MAG TPA: class I SAM-dependent methyltransferase [Planctomycetota bacterium]